MDLKEFIKESLVQISEGINAANLELKETGAKVNPIGISSNPNESKSYGRITKQRPQGDKLVHWVAFDVALHASSESEKGGGLKLSIASIGANASGKSSDSEKSESRIKFEIPMMYPQGK